MSARATSRFVSIQHGDLLVRLDLENGAEMIHLGPAGQNVLASYDWASVAGGRNHPSNLGLAWLERYRGGWQVLFPNIGPSASWRGISVGHHGDWSRTTVDVVERTASSVRVSAIGALRLRLTRSIGVYAGNRVEVTQEVINEGAERAPFIWGEHPAFDLEPGVLIEMAPGRVVAASKDPPLGDLVPEGEGSWPFAPAKDGSDVDLSTVPHGPVERLAFLPDRPDARATITWPTDSQSLIERLSMEWDKRAYPHAYLWTQIGGQGFPYLGRARITAIELCSTWPPDGLTRAVAEHRAEWVGPGERRTSAVSIVLERR